MVGGVISDIYHAEDRNAPMALFSGAALFGTGLGPIISSAIVQRASWRWVYYAHAIASAVCVIVIYILFKETRGSILLARKANVLNTYYEKLEEAGYTGVLIFDASTGKQRVQRIRWRVKGEEERESLAKMIRISCYRPFRKSTMVISHVSTLTNMVDIDLLFTEPVVFFFSLWVSFSWAVLYLQFGSIPLVFTTNHNFTLEQSGAVFTGMSKYVRGAREAWS